MPDFQQQFVDLPGAQLSLYKYQDYGFVFGQLIKGQVTETELIKGLENADISFGIDMDAIDLITNGSHELVPLAAAYHTHKSPVVEDLFLQRRELMLATCDDSLKRLPENLTLFHVARNQVLKKVLTPKSTILKYPDGRETLVNEDTSFNISFFKGANTILEPESGIIKSAIDGIAHRTVSGIVHVYPSKSIKGIGVTHRNIDFKHSIKVKNDVNSGSWLDIPASLTVEGMINSSTIYTGGDVHCQSGLSNNSDSKEIFMEIGGNLMTSFVNNYNIWVGDSAFISSHLDRAKLQVRENLVVPVIRESIVRAGQNIVTDSVEDNSEIYLGQIFVDNPEVDNRKKLIRLHKTRLTNIVTSLDHLKFQINQNRDNFQKLCKRPRTPRSQLRRFYYTIKDGMQQYHNWLEEYQQVGNQLIKEQGVLETYEALTLQNSAPQIKVFGEIKPGVRIIGPNNEINFRESEKSVSYSVNNVTGYLEKQQLHNVNIPVQ